VIHLDTHVAIRLHTRRASRLSSRARQLAEREVCVISPMVVLELEMLFELGRVPAGPDTLLAELGRQIELSVSDASFAGVIDAARTFAWTRDPFDRLIVANAMLEDAQLVTADETILANFKDAVW
jgi:PIN domain nuclease of toxin-antitoxin system